MKIIRDKALLITLEDPVPVLNAIPKSKQVGDETLVYWGINEVHKLKEFGVDVPSPIERKYPWAQCMITPFEHQIKTAAFLTLYKRAFCFNEQGTGKTASAIWASDYLMSLGIIHRVLIICPLSIMDTAWRAEMFDCAMHRTVDIAYGSAKKRAATIAGNAEYVIINYDGVKVVHDEIKKGGFDLIIADEATHYKNANTARWKKLHKLITDDTWVWMMTGTPAAQSPLDAYGLAKIVNPTAVPKWFGSFRDLVMFRVSQFRWLPKDSATTTVHRVLQPAIRFTKEECLDLPDIVYLTRDVELTPQQKKYYAELKKKMVIKAAGEEITAINAANMMNKLLQISSGAVYSDDNESIAFDISNRYSVLKEVIDESSHKVLIFVAYRHTIRVVAEKLKADSITGEIIQGNVSVAERTRIIKAFQENPDPRVLILQPAAAAHGVTLTAADTVVWWSPISSLEIYLQANARVHRAGQVNKCSVIHLQGSIIERHVYGLLRNKIDIHTKIIKLYQDLIK